MKRLMITNIWCPLSVYDRQDYRIKKTEKTNANVTCLFQSLTCKSCKSQSIFFDYFNVVTPRPVVLRLWR